AATFCTAWMTGAASFITGAATFFDAHHRRGGARHRLRDVHDRRRGPRDAADDAAEAEPAGGLRTAPGRRLRPGERSALDKERRVAALHRRRADLAEPHAAAVHRAAERLLRLAPCAEDEAGGVTARRGEDAGRGDERIGGLRAPQLAEVPL